ncbi:response regulator [Pedobacter namyangjuensis]|uniref:response regulator n=1 Tax=Pedobacter namyangjuensis TaxID=600626 RepID=UPI000DE409D4|nr:response regulator [Pedobacter namyangjuensis]
MRKNIFVLDDNDDIRAIIEEILKEEQHEVSGFDTVESFRKGIQFAQPDLIILDVMLTDGNGLDICDELKENRRTQHIPIIMMSANTIYSDAKKKCETEDFINKPFDIDDFVNRVNEQLY